ncbi:MAG: hypothetical protein HYT11_03435 [Candidatus Levybacteria bacterium]|nr:hypothetical protein [Candidatus Levybacteria bacterium]
MRIIIFFFILTFYFFTAPAKTDALEDPRSVPNNKFGIHILFPSELDTAAQLINSSGGDWGYVTIPIQAGDRNRDTWQNFMNDARRLHLIPIVRLATRGDYFNTAVWKKPTFADILDFANFLEDLNWPTKNKYIVVFNEVNRDDEWGGDANANEYTEILAYTLQVFKERDNDFFIISAGLDNAAGNGNMSINQYNFIRQIHSYNPDVFKNIDGIASHSYPNPDFSQPPNFKRPTSIWSFLYERNLIRQLAGVDLPIFITETGWKNDKIDQSTIASFYQEAFATAWSDKDIVAVTPFLLRAGTEPFKAFSFLGTNDSHTKYYQTFTDIKKITGSPSLISPQTIIAIIKTPNYTVKHFNETSNMESDISLTNIAKDAFYWIMKI